MILLFYHLHEITNFIFRSCDWSSDLFTMYCGELRGSHKLNAVGPVILPFLTCYCWYWVSLVFHVYLIPSTQVNFEDTCKGFLEVAKVLMFMHKYAPFLRFGGLASIMKIIPINLCVLPTCFLHLVHLQWAIFLYLTLFTSLLSYV